MAVGVGPGQCVAAAGTAGVFHALDGVAEGGAVDPAAHRERRLPMKPHAHAHAAEHEELRLGAARCAERGAKCQQPARRVRAIEDPDAGAWHRLPDLAPLLVDQVRRRDHESATKALRWGDGSQADGHHRLSAAHLGVQHGRGRAMTEEQGGRGGHGLALGGEGQGASGGRAPWPIAGRVGRLRRVGSGCGPAATDRRRTR
jgi:hypothetical protein